MTQTLSPDAAQELAAIRDQVATALARLDELLAGQVPPNPAEAAPVVSLARTEAIEWVLREARRPMGPVEVWSHLTDLGRDDPKMEVQVTTYELWRRGRLAKLRRGIYCSPDCVPAGAEPVRWEG